MKSKMEASDKKIFDKVAEKISDFGDGELDFQTKDIEALLQHIERDEKYIIELESMCTFLAHCYQKCKEQFRDRHLRTCASDNPDRRELNECEKEQLLKFPLIQGWKQQEVIEKIASLNFKSSTDGGLILSRITKPKL